MKKALIAFGMLLMTKVQPFGGLVTKHASSVQLTVDAARSTAQELVRFQYQVQILILRTATLQHCFSWNYHIWCI